MLKHIGRVWIAVAVLAFAVGCGKEDKPKSEPEPEAETEAAKAGEETPELKPKRLIDDPPAGAEGEDEDPSGLVPKVEALADKACKCSDKACANGVQDELSTLMGQMKDIQDNEREAVSEHMQKLQKCLADAQAK